MKMSQKLAALMLLFGLTVLANGPLGSSFPFPPDEPSPSGNII